MRHSPLPTKKPSNQHKNRVVKRLYLNIAKYIIYVSAHIYICIYTKSPCECFIY